MLVVEGVVWGGGGVHLRVACGVSKKITEKKKTEIKIDPLENACIL